MAGGYLVVLSAALVVEGAGAAVDAIVVEAAFDMTGLSLSVPQYRLVPYGRYDIVVAGGSLAGEFSATGLPSGGLYDVGYTANTAMFLRRRSGLLIFVR